VSGTTGAAGVRGIELLMPAGLESSYGHKRDSLSKRRVAC
jgi:hypothetical protein